MGVTEPGTPTSSKQKKSVRQAKKLGNNKSISGKNANNSITMNQVKINAYKGGAKDL